MTRAEEIEAVRALAAQRKFAEASARIDSIVEGVSFADLLQSEETCELLYLQGVCLVQIGQAEKAVEVLDALVRHHQSDGRSYFPLGLARQLLGDGERAKQAFERGAELGNAQCARKLNELGAREPQKEEVESLPPVEQRASVTRRRARWPKVEAKTRISMSMIFLWIIANTVSGAAGESLVGSVGVEMFGVGGWLFFKTLFGACIGAGQYLSLRAWLKPPNAWIFAGALSGMLAAMPALGIGVLTWEQFGLFFGVCLAIALALLVGTARFSLTWIPACILGGTAAGIVAPRLAAAILGPTDPILVSYAMTAGAGFGFVFGAVTALSLPHLLKALR